MINDLGKELTNSEASRIRMRNKEWYKYSNRLNVVNRNWGEISGRRIIKRFTCKVIVFFCGYACLGMFVSEKECKLMKVIYRQTYKRKTNH